MNELVGRTQTLTSWSAALLEVAVGVAVAVGAAIVMAVRGAGVVTTITIRAGSAVPCGPVTQATGGLRRGWPPAVLVRARGPPSRRCRRWPVSRAVSSSASVSLFVKFIKPAAAGAAPVAVAKLWKSEGVGHPGGSDPDPGGLPVPADEESNDEITRSAARGRRSGAGGGSCAHVDAERSTAAGWRHMHRLTSSSRANDL